MKHIKLFEAFMNRETMNEMPMSVITLYLETEIAVGVFISDTAKYIYSELAKSIPQDSVVSVEMVELKEGDDLVIVPMGGQNISTSNAQEMEIYGDPVGDVVELGRDYSYDNSGSMVFKVNKELGGFTVLDSSGQTRLVTVDELMARV